MISNIMMIQRIFRIRLSKKEISINWQYGMTWTQKISIIDSYILKHINSTHNLWSKVLKELNDEHKLI